MYVICLQGFTYAKLTNLAIKPINVSVISWKCHLSLFLTSGDVSFFDYLTPCKLENWDILHRHGNASLQF